MASFSFTQNVGEQQYASGALGADASNKLTTNDIGKAVKYGAADNFVLCAKGDEIDGILETVVDHTVNDGFAFGSVQMGGRVTTAVVDAAEVGTAAVGTRVAAGTQTAINTAGGLVVEILAGADWKVIKVVSGTGVAGDTVMIERI